LELTVDAGVWRNPISFLNEKAFNNLSYKSTVAKYRKPFFVHLTNSFVLIMLLLGIMSLIMFGISKINVYLFYGMHALMISLYYVNKVTYLSDTLYDLIGMGGIHVFNNAIQPIMYYFLALFLYEFLDARHEDRKFARLLNYFARFALLSSAVIFLTFFIDKNLSENIYNLYRVFIIVYSTFISGYLIYKRANISTVIIGYSNAILILLGSVAMYASIKNIIIYGMAPLDFFTIGMLIFIMGITTALGFLAYQGELDRITAKESIIKLEREAKQKLEGDLQISKLRERNNHVEKEIAELELLVLRNQLNPHFLYNSMNTLKLYILNNENIDAAKFIDRFSGLFRKVLNNSRQRLITLYDEIEAMRQYLDLEQIRFRNAFTYAIEIDEIIDSTFTRIPPMIFQPFLENSINHGIGLNEDRKGYIELKIEAVDEEYYRVIIIDNGVGREYAQNLRSNKLNSHKSLGTQIIDDRLTAINKLYNYHSFFEYTDLYDENNKPIGTRVDLILPLEL
jgi:sensor histidine kinase YesM